MNRRCSAACPRLKVWGCGSMSGSDHAPLNFGPPVGEGCEAGCKAFSDGWSHHKSCASLPTLLPNVYFVGSHATGKSSRARWVADTYGLPMIHEVARAEVTRLETTIDRLRQNVDAISEYQRGVWRGQLAAEAATPSPFVSDRSLDNLAYMALHGEGVATIVGGPEFQDYLHKVQESVVFFVQPHDGAVNSDGIRPHADTLRDGQMIVTGSVLTIMEIFSVPYIPVPSASPKMQELIIGAVLDRSGFKRR